MIEQNKEKFDFLRITNWHKYGYKGQNMKIGSTNECQDDLDFFHGKLINPFNLSKPLNSHGQKVLDCIHQVIPSAEIHMLPYGLTSQGKGDLFNGMDYCLANNIKVLQNSSGGIINDILDDKYKYYHNKGLFMITSAGNKGENGVTGFAESDYWYSIGGCDAIYKNGKVDDVKINEKSSKGHEVDFLNFFSYYIHNAKKDNVFSMYGTSFSSPVFSGMCIMILQYYKDNFNIELSNEELIDFLSDHSYNQWGILRLPDLDKLKEEGIEEDYFKAYIKEKKEDEKMIDFKDVKEEDWFTDDVYSMVNKGIINGYPDYTFKPNKKPTRAELCAILNRMISYLENK